MQTSDHQARLESEKHFHNDRAVEESRIHQDKYYVAVKNAQNKFEQLIQARVAGGDVLEIGCFHGFAAEIYSKGAKSYTGIDISDVAIEQANANARAKGLTHCQFLTRDACSTQFPDDSFDTIIACGIIHHLPIERALQEIHRILKPGGRVIMFEPMGENPLINWYRKQTPNARTPDETPLVRSDIAAIQSIFPKTSVQFYGLTTLVSVPMRNKPALFSLAYRMFAQLDKLLFLTPIRWWGWMIVAEGQKHR